MKSWLLAFLTLHFLSPLLPAQAWGAALLQAIRAASKSLDNVVDDAGRIAVRESSVLLREHQEAQQILRELGELKQREVRTIKEILPNGSIEYGIRHLPFNVTSTRSTRPSVEEMIAQGEHQSKVAESWPENARKRIFQAEANSLKFGWDSFEGYRGHAQALLKLDDSKSAGKAIDELETKYVQTLSSTALRLARVRQAVNCLAEARRMDLPDPFSEKSIREARMWQQKSIESISYRFGALAAESPGGAGLATSFSKSADIFHGWDVESRAAYLLNRVQVAGRLNSRVAYYERELKEVIESLENAGEFWKMDAHFVSPSTMVQYDTILENAIPSATTNTRKRFRILTPQREIDRSWSKVSATLRTSLDDVVVLNLLPTKRSDVSKWKDYSATEKSAYIEWGQRVQNLLAHRKVPMIQDLSSPQKIAEQIKQTAGKQKVLIVLGEAHDKTSIKLPKSELPVDVITRAVPYNMRVVGLFCGSAESLGQVPGLAVSGMLKAEEAMTILNNLLVQVDDAAPKTVGELIGDSLILAKNRKTAFLVIGGTSVLIEELVTSQQPSSAPQTNSIPRAVKNGKGQQRK